MSKVFVFESTPGAVELLSSRLASWLGMRICCLINNSLYRYRASGDKYIHYGAVYTAPSSLERLRFVSQTPARARVFHLLPITDSVNSYYKIC